jgi:hypothetical protein
VAKNLEGQLHCLIKYNSEIMSLDLFELALPMLRREFDGHSELQDIAAEYGLDDIVCGFFIIVQTDHPEYELRLTNLEMNLGGCNFSYNLPSEGHPYDSDRFQDRLFLYDCDVSKKELDDVLGSVLTHIEEVEVDRLIEH